MVCNRCKMVVKSELEKIGLHPLTVDLGEVDIKEELTNDEKQKVNAALADVGFSLIDDKKSRIIEKTKNLRDIKTVAAIMGDDYKVIIKTYLHPDEDNKYDLVASL